MPSTFIFNFRINTALICDWWRVLFDGRREICNVWCLMVDVRFVMCDVNLRCLIQLLNLICMKIKVCALTKISSTSHHHSLGQCQIYPDYVCWIHPWEQWVNSDCRSKFCCYFRWIVSSLKQLHNYIIHEKNLHKPFSMMTKWPYLFLIWTLEALSYWYFVENLNHSWF